MFWVEKDKFWVWSFFFISFSCSYFLIFVNVFLLLFFVGVISIYKALFLLLVFIDNNWSNCTVIGCCVSLGFYFYWNEVVIVFKFI